MGLFRKGAEEAKINDETQDESETTREIRKERKMAEEKASTLTQDVEIKAPSNLAMP